MNSEIMSALESHRCNVNKIWFYDLIKTRKNPSQPTSLVDHTTSMPPHILLQLHLQRHKNVGPLWILKRHITFHFMIKDPNHLHLCYKTKFVSSTHSVSKSSLFTCLSVLDTSRFSSKIMVEGCKVSWSRSLLVQNITTKALVPTSQQLFYPWTFFKGLPTSLVLPMNYKKKLDQYSLEMWKSHGPMWKPFSNVKESWPNGIIC